MFVVIKSLNLIDISKMMKNEYIDKNSYSLGGKINYNIIIILVNYNNVIIKFVHLI